MCHNVNSTTPRLIKIATQHCVVVVVVVVAVAVAVAVAVVVYIEANKMYCGMKVGYLR